MFWFWVVTAEDDGVVIVDGAYINYAYPEYWPSVCSNFFLHPSRTDSDGSWAIKVEMGIYTDYFRPDPNLATPPTMCTMMTVTK